MKALQRYQAEPKKLKIFEVPKPKVQKGFCIIKVVSSGICGRDIEHHNTRLPISKIPFTPGHEFSGIIDEIEKNNKFKVGDRVVSETVYSVCNKCKSCKKNIYNLCPKRKNIGGSVNGSFADFVKVPISSLHLIPKSISHDEAALIEPTCVAYNAVFMNSKINSNYKILILGIGTIGLLTAQMCKLKSQNIHLLCLKSEFNKIKIAKSLGFKKLLFFEDLDNSDYIKYNNYFDVVFDTVGGVSNTFNCALSYVIPNGQIIKLGWFMGKNKELNLDAIIRKSISVKGSFSHNFKIWEKCIKLVKNKKINLRKIIGRVDDLKNWKNSFNDVINKKYVKIILRS